MIKLKALIFVGLFAALLPFGFAQDPSALQTIVRSEVKVYEIGVTDLELVDTARNRKVPLRIYAPTAPSNTAASESQVATTPLPLIVFSHGLGGSRSGYSYLGRFLAAHGYIVVHPQHEGSDRAIWTANVFSLFGNMLSATSETQVIDRALDIRFLITELLNSSAWGIRVDPQKIGIAGHSYGANTALMVSGAKIERLTESLHDPRIKAALIISAPPFRGEGDMRPILGSISIPTLHVTGTDDVIRVPGHRSELVDRLAVFEATSSQVKPSHSAHTKQLVVFKGGTHSVFTDRIDRSGPELNAMIKKGTQELALNFFEIHFRQQSPQSLERWLITNQDKLSKTTGSKS